MKSIRWWRMPSAKRGGSERDPGCPRCQCPYQRIDIRERRARQNYDAWLEGRFQLCISPQIMEELKRVLKYPRIMKRLEKRQAKELLENLGTSAE